MKGAKRGGAVAAMPVPKPPVSTSEEAPKVDPDKKLKFTVYFEPRFHDRIREIAFSRRISIHTLVMEGIDMWLAANKFPRREVEPKKKGKRV